MHFKVLIYWNFVCSIAQKVGFLHMFICKEPAIMHKNDQGPTSVMFCIQHRLVLLLGPSKAQVGS